MAYSVILLPSQKTIQLEEGENLLQGAKRQGIDIPSSCGGFASCTDCRVQIVRGDEFLSPIEFNEMKILGNTFHLTKERLACQLKVHGDIAVDLSSLREKSLNLKPATKVIRRKPKSIEEKQFDQASVEPSINLPKKLGGGKRPKAFRYSEEEDS